MRYAQRAAALRIEIGVEHAVAAAELELQARTFSDLKRRRSKMTDQFICGEAAQAPVGLGRRSDRDGLRDRNGRPRGARGEAHE